MPQSEFIVDRTLKTAPCPTCGKPAPRHSIRTLHPQDLHHGRIQVHISRHVCRNPMCPDKRRYFTARAQGIEKASRYTTAVKTKALKLLEENTLERTSDILQRDFNVRVPSGTLHDWRVAAMETEVRHGSELED